MPGSSGSRKALAKKYAIGELCHYCGNAKGTTIDHIVPKSLGGTLYLWNIQPACATCNHKKADSWPTCECEKCRSAVIRHLSWPDKADATFKSLEVTRRHTEENIANLYETIERLQRQLADHDAFVRTLHDLTTTAQDGKVGV